MTKDSLVSRGGADSESYVARATTKSRGIDPATSPRALMADAKIAEGPEPNQTERPAATPVIPLEVVQENLRRVRAGAANTLITILPDGKRMYREDRVVHDGDGQIDTVRDGGHRTDRGEGVTDSLKRLAKEGRVHVDGLLPGQKRSADGRFTK